MEVTKQIKETAEFLLDTDLTWKESETQRDTFTANHVVYDARMDYRGNVFYFQFQCNPQYNEPEKLEMILSVLRDADFGLVYNDYPDFAEDLADYNRKSYEAWLKCCATRDYFVDQCGFDHKKVSDLSYTIESYEDEVREAMETLQMKRDFDHPALPEGYHYIEDLKKNVPLSDVDQCAVDSISTYGDMEDLLREAADGAVDVYTFDLLEWYGIPANRGYVSQAIDDGLCGDTQDIDKLIQSGQYQAYLEEMNDHIEDIVQVCLYNELIEEGYVVISDELNSGIENIAGDFTIDKDNSLAEPWDDVECAIEEISEEGGSCKPALTIEEIRKEFAPSCVSSVKERGEASRQASKELSSIDDHVHDAPEASR